jgi:drug/metabolite transporter (DMT)-like permease
MGTDNRKGVMYAIFTASLWGFMAIILKIVTTTLSPVTVTWFRFFTAFALLALWTLLFRRSDFTIFSRPPILLFPTAVFLGFNYLGFITGIKYISPSSAQVFIQVAPVGFALSGIIFFREHVNWKHILGFLMVLSGIGLFYSEQLRDLARGSENFTLGMLLVLGGGVSWAVFATLQKSLLKTTAPNQLNLFIYAFCALVLFPLARFDGLIGMNVVNWYLLFYLGLNTVLAYGSLALAIKFTEATRVSVIITLNPIITFVTMAILSRMQVSWMEAESFSLLSILGALMVLSGAILVISAGWNNKRKSRTIDPAKGQPAPL